MSEFLKKHEKKRMSDWIGRMLLDQRAFFNAKMSHLDTKSNIETAS